MPRTRLPIDDLLPELVRVLNQARCIVLQAPPGAGKTTRVPPAILAAAPSEERLIVMVEPRRIAVRAAARRMAYESASQVGEVFGYQVRFDRQISSATRVVAVTPGILLRWLQADPYLERVHTLIFDEFHERNLEVDLALGLAKLLRSTVREDLRLVVMSATLDARQVAAYLDHCPVLTSEGRLFPVQIEYQPPDRDIPLSLAVRRAVETNWPRHTGDALVFLPGVREIRECMNELATLTESTQVKLYPLYGELLAHEQDRALQKHAYRKIVLATNVAETSVTVDGVSLVIDTGLVRQMEFHAATGLDRLALVKISQAAADQRAGRAGRQQAGLAVRLWAKHDHQSRPLQTTPEIQRLDLAPAVLQLLALGETNPSQFPWIDAPRPESLQQSLQLLRWLDAWNDEGLTPIGRRLAEWPIHPRLGRMLHEAERLGCTERAALAVALLSERDPFERAHQGRSLNTESDLLDRVEALEAYQLTGTHDGSFGSLNRGACDAIFSVRDQLFKLVSPGSDTSDAALLECLLRAYPDRVIRRRGPADPRGRMVGGRGVKLAPSSGVKSAELLIGIDMDAGSGTEAIVRQASLVRREWLKPLDTRVAVWFDDSTEQLQCRKQLVYHNLVVEEWPAKLPDEADAARILAEAAQRHLSQVLPSDDTPAGKLLCRLRCLRSWLPDADLLTWSEAELAALLPELCRGLRSFEQLRNAAWHEAIMNSLTWAQRQLLDHEAPEWLLVPSGSRIPLHYEPGKPPILAVRIQEIFGWTETPRIARGRVKVLLHLLAPNFRPQQVTDDLASFWKHGYPLIRKELRGRYPKHSWPDDPLTAEPMRGAKRRGE